MPRICPRSALHIISHTDYSSASTDNLRKWLNLSQILQIIYLHQPLQVVKSLTDFTDVFSDYNGRPASTDNHQLTAADNHSTTWKVECPSGASGS